MTVGDLLRRADSYELSEWQALFMLRNEESIRRELDASAANSLKTMKG